MNRNRTSNFLHFLSYINSRRSGLYEEFSKQQELQKMMKPENIQTFFQPILSLEKGSTIGFEILNRPQSTPHFPNTEQFYDYVGKSRDVFKVETFLRNLSFERFSAQLKHLQVENRPLMFLNIQSQLLADPSYRRGKTLELLDKHHISPHQIVLELTEKEAVINYTEFERMITHYRNQGFRIAVDDVGTGYNSLQTLLSVKPEFIKLDKSLIRHINRHPEQQYLVELLLQFASRTDTMIIAEGIETHLELDFLRNLGIHLGQGYALGRPKKVICNGSLPFSPVLQKKSV